MTGDLHDVIVIIQSVQLLHKAHISKAHTAQGTKLTFNAARLRHTKISLRLKAATPHHNIYMVSLEALVRSLNGQLHI